MDQDRDYPIKVFDVVSVAGANNCAAGPDDGEDWELIDARAVVNWAAGITNRQWGLQDGSGTHFRWKQTAGPASSGTVFWFSTDSDWDEHPRPITLRSGEHLTIYGTGVAGVETITMTLCVYRRSGVRTGA